MSIYERSQKTASRLLEKFNQSGLYYTTPGSVTGPEWDPVEVPPVQYDVNGTAQGVQQKFADGTYINASDIQCTLSVFETEPTTSGTMQIAGRTHQIIRVDRIPATGTVVAWRVFCKS